MKSTKYFNVGSGSGAFSGGDDQINPLSHITNLVDAMLVFAVAMMVSLVTYLQIPALLQNKDYTVITNPGKPDMEIIVKEGEEIKSYEATDSTGAGQGELLGQAYRLPDGRVVYVPASKESQTSKETSPENSTTTE